MTGISEAKQVVVTEVPENLPRLSQDWEPVYSISWRETVITLETENTDLATVEIKMVEKFPHYLWLIINLQSQQR